MLLNKEKKYMELQAIALSIDAMNTPPIPAIVAIEEQGGFVDMQADDTVEGFLPDNNWFDFGIRWTRNQIELGNKLCTDRLMAAVLSAAQRDDLIIDDNDYAYRQAAMGAAEFMANLKDIADEN